MFLFLIYCFAFSRIQVRDEKKIPSTLVDSPAVRATISQLSLKKVCIPVKSMITAKLMISIAISYCHGLSALQPCDKDVKMSPEEYIGYLSSMSFQWVTKVIVSGYKGTLNNERKRFQQGLWQKLEKTSYFSKAAEAATGLVTCDSLRN